MKPIIKLIIVVLLISCNTKKETPNSNLQEEKVEVVSSKKVALISPCDLLSQADIKATFELEGVTIENYARNPYPDTNRCEFVWNNANDVTKGSQVMITISSNFEIDDMPRKFSNMLRMDIEKGVMGSKQQIIKPTPITDFGTNAYHWSEPDFQNVQKIKFQMDEAYLVEVMYNSNVQITQDEIKNKLIQVGNQIKRNLNNL